MPRIAKPLTDTQIRNAKVENKEYNLSDGAGLYLRIKTNGSKCWIFNYYKPNSKSRTNIGLGIYPDLALKIAREIKAEYQSLLAQNIDPAIHKKISEKNSTQLASITLERVFEEWLEIEKTKLTSKYAKDIESSLRLHVLPCLGRLPITELTAVVAIETLRPLAARGTLEMVKRICQRLNKIMTYAVNTGRVKSNCLTGISSAFESPKKKHLPTITPEKLPELIKKMEYSNITLTTKCLIKWQLHTMVRPGEAAGARWEEIDFKDAVWRIPEKRMKKRKSHAVPLSKQALFLLEVMKPIANHRDYVFPADRNPKHHANEQTANMALKRMGFGGKLVAHGLRSIASTALNEQGFNPSLIEKALSHEDKNAVRAAYNRAEYMNERREMMQWWSDQIERNQTA